MRVMDTLDNPVPEPRSERIARYKAERRRELTERFGNMEELPSKCVRRDRKEDPVTHNSGDGDERVNGRTHGVANGVQADHTARPDDPTA